MSICVNGGTSFWRSGRKSVMRLILQASGSNKQTPTCRTSPQVNVSRNIIRCADVRNREVLHRTTLITIRLTMKACKHFSKESHLLRSAFSSEAKHSHTLNVSGRRTDSASTTLLASERSRLTSRNCSEPSVQQKSLLHPCCAVSSRFGTLIFCATSCPVESVANPFGSASSRCRGSF